MVICLAPTDENTPLSQPDARAKAPEIILKAQEAGFTVLHSKVITMTVRNLTTSSKHPTSNHTGPCTTRTQTGYTPTNPTITTLLTPPVPVPADRPGQ